MVSFLYGTKIGRGVLQLILKSRIDKYIVKFLWSPLSKPLISLYIKKNHIPMQDFRGQHFGTFRDFFVRKRESSEFDSDPSHLISPCDALLSAFPINEDSSFFIKGSHYQLCDLLQDHELGKKYHGGDCLIFRLCASDYHHYCYIDDGCQEKNHYIPGELHSVQPIACDTYPVYTLNRRVWTLLMTENFGPVIQIEIGALIVGGIANDCENTRFYKGMEMGHFELAGSTIVLLFEKDRIRLLPHISQHLSDGREFRVKQGMWIGSRKG
ncbi:MAG: phosphatidylserine decarboxylase [Lachnospiraceae bacterium]